MKKEKLKEESFFYQFIIQLFIYFQNISELLTAFDKRIRAKKFRTRFLISQIEIVSSKGSADYIET